MNTNQEYTYKTTRTLSGILTGFPGLMIKMSGLNEVLQTQDRLIAEVEWHNHWLLNVAKILSG